MAQIPGWKKKGNTAVTVPVPGTVVLDSAALSVVCQAVRAAFPDAITLLVDPAAFGEVRISVHVSDHGTFNHIYPSYSLSGHTLAQIADPWALATMVCEQLAVEITRQRVLAAKAASGKGPGPSASPGPLESAYKALTEGTPEPYYNPLPIPVDKLAILKIDGTPVTYPKVTMKSLTSEYTDMQAKIVHQYQTGGHLYPTPTFGFDPYKSTYHPTVTALAELAPAILTTQAQCPACATVSGPLAGIIPHLNDGHKWTREQIADWLDGPTFADVDLVLNHANNKGD